MNMPVCVHVYITCVLWGAGHASVHSICPSTCKSVPFNPLIVLESHGIRNFLPLSLTLKGCLYFRTSPPHKTCNAGERKKGTEGCWTLLQRSIHPSFSFLLFSSLSLCILRGRSSTLGAAEPSMANTKPGSVCSNYTGVGGRGSQFEALLLDELDVEATAVLELPVVATDLRMWGSRKGSLASWWTSIRSSFRYTKHRRMKACNSRHGYKKLG